MELDMDTTNGICGASVDTARSVPAGANFTVAVCLTDGNLAPFSGDLVDMKNEVAYPAFVTAPDVIDDGSIDLNANPDWRAPAAGAGWDCNQLDGPASAPSGSPSPATITCSHTPPVAQALTSPSVELTRISFQATGTGGPSPMTLTGNLLGSGSEVLCGIDIECIGGTIEVTPAADIEVEKDCTPEPVVAGGVLTCTVTVTNNGPSDAGNVAVFDNMTDAPAVVYDEAATDLANGSNVCSLFIFGPVVAADNVVICGQLIPGILPPGNTPFGLLANTSQAFDLVFNVAEESAGKQLENGALGVAGAGIPLTSNPDDPNLDPLQAFLATQPPCDVDPDPLTCALLVIGGSPTQLCGAGSPIPVIGPACNNEARDQVAVASADVSIAKSVNVAQAVEGDSLTYTVTVSVAAGSPASGVVISDTVDAEQTITSATVGGGYTCAENTATNVAGIVGQTATCTLEQIVPAASNVVMTVNTDVVGSADGNCTNQASVEWADPIEESNITSIPCFPPSVRMQKDATLDEDLVITDEANLFLCVDPNPAGPGPGSNDSCEYYDAALGEVVNNGRGHLVVFERLFNQLDPQGAGAFEFQLKFDHKIFDIEIQHGTDLNGDGDCSDNGETSDGDDTVGDPSPTDCYLYTTGRIPNAPGGVGGCDMSIVTENYILFGCVSKENPNTLHEPANGPAETGSMCLGPDEALANYPQNGIGYDDDGDLVVDDGCPIELGPIGASDVVATLHISPEPDLKFRLTPGQKNGVLRTILDENCEVADIFGDPLGSGQYDELGREIPLIGIVTGGLVEICDDLTVTTRILEGDLDLDCEVDLTDDQQIAFRYGSFFGNLLYDPWFDLEPSLKDFDIDIKDLQKVFGRNGSTCDDPIPAQDPQEGGGFGGNPDPGPLP
jgi:uncharacterized repeat protein (TIGR01451 family)